MRADHREAGERGGPAAETDEQDDEAELGDGPEREDELEVVLPQGTVAAEQQGAATEHHDDGHPDREVGVGRREPRDEVHARLDHRSGVEIGAHGRGSRHRRGEPEVRGDERRLRRGPDEQAHDRRRHRAARRRVLEEPGEAVAGLGRRPEDDDTAEHRQAARRGDDDRLHGGASARLAVVIVADEQVGEDGRQLPEHEHEHHVVCCDETDHGAGEGHEHPAEPAEAGGGRREVRGAVDEDEGSDRPDEQEHQPRQGVHAEGEVHPEHGDPRHDLRGSVAVHDATGPAERVHGSGRGCGRHDEECAPTPPGDQCGRG